MEKKKLLLVSVSTGIFLMLVLGASILIFSPRVVSQPETIAAAIPPGNPAAPPGPVDPVVTVETPDAGAQKPALPVSIETVETPAPAVNIEPPKTEAAPPQPASVAQPQRPAAAAPKPAAQPQRQAAPAPKSGPSYWVQIGSYSQKSGADKVKADLSGRGLGSVISDSEVQGKIYYRVRVGPYVSKAEADYWLRFVKDIKGFEKSQVWQSGT